MFAIHFNRPRSGDGDFQAANAKVLAEHPDLRTHPDRVPYVSSVRLVWTAGFAYHDAKVASGRKKSDADPKKGVYVGVNYIFFLDTKQNVIPFTVRSVDGRTSGDKFRNALCDLQQNPTQPWRNWFNPIGCQHDVVVDFLHGKCKFSTFGVFHANKTAMAAVLIITPTPNKDDRPTVRPWRIIYHDNQTAPSFSPAHINSQIQVCPKEVQYMHMLAGSPLRTRPCRRLWLRALWQPDKLAQKQEGVVKALLTFMDNFPGLRRQIGAILALYYTPVTAETFITTVSIKDKLSMAKRKDSLYRQLSNENRNDSTSPSTNSRRGVKDTAVDFQYEAVHPTIGAVTIWIFRESKRTVRRVVMQQQLPGKDTAMRHIGKLNMTPNIGCKWDDDDDRLDLGPVFVDFSHFAFRVDPRKPPDTKAKRIGARKGEKRCGELSNSYSGKYGQVMGHAIFMEDGGWRCYLARLPEDHTFRIAEDLALTRTDKSGASVEELFPPELSDSD